MGGAAAAASSPGAAAGAGLGHRNGRSPVKGRRPGGSNFAKDAEEKKEVVMIINGPATNVAAGGGLRGIRHLRKNPKVLSL
jgi:hypothetical protein